MMIRRTFVIVAAMFFFHSTLALAARDLGQRHVDKAKRHIKKNFDNPRYNENIVVLGAGSSRRWVATTDKQGNVGLALFKRTYRKGKPIMNLEASTILRKGANGFDLKFSRDRQRHGTIKALSFRLDPKHGSKTTNGMRDTTWVGFVENTLSHTNGQNQRSAERNFPPKSITLKYSGKMMNVSFLNVPAEKTTELNVGGKNAKARMLLSGVKTIVDASLNLSENLFARR